MGKMNGVAGACVFIGGARVVARRRPTGGAAEIVTPDALIRFWNLRDWGSAPDRRAGWVQRVGLVRFRGRARAACDSMIRTNRVALRCYASQQVLGSLRMIWVFECVLRHHCDLDAKQV
jgi:hypothetical protein